MVCSPSDRIAKEKGSTLLPTLSPSPSKSWKLATVGNLSPVLVRRLLGSPDSQPQPSDSPQSLLVPPSSGFLWSRTLGERPGALARSFTLLELCHVRATGEGCDQSSLLPPVAPHARSEDTFLLPRAQVPLAAEEEDGCSSSDVLRRCSFPAVCGEMRSSSCCERRPRPQRPLTEWEPDAKMAARMVIRQCPLLLPEALRGTDATQSESSGVLEARSNVAVSHEIFDEDNDEDEDEDDGQVTGT